MNATKFVWSIGVVSLTACRHTAPLPESGYWVSSDSSQYSPTARFRVVVLSLGDQVRIAVDSGIVSTPGQLVPEAPPIMRNLYLTAYIAAPNSDSLALATNAQTRRADRRPWRATAASDSVLIVDALRFGEQYSIHPIQLAVVRSTSRPPASEWVVFRISGNTMTFDAPLVRGAAPRGREVIGGVRVYACSDRDLRGRLDAARTEGLRRTYGQVC